MPHDPTLHGTPDPVLATIMGGGSSPFRFNNLEHAIANFEYAVRRLDPGEEGGVSMALNSPGATGLIVGRLDARSYMGHGELDVRSSFATLTDPLRRENAELVARRVGGLYADQARVVAELVKDRQASTAPPPRTLADAHTAIREHGSGSSFEDAGELFPEESRANLHQRLTDLAKQPGPAQATKQQTLDREWLLEGLAYARGELPEAGDPGKDHRVGPRPAASIALRILAHVALTPGAEDAEQQAMNALEEAVNAAPDLEDTVATFYQRHFPGVEPPAFSQDDDPAPTP